MCLLDLIVHGKPDELTNGPMQQDRDRERSNDQNTWVGAAGRGEFASITWAREIKNINKRLLTPSALDTIIRRINEQEITNSKDIRKLRHVLRGPIVCDQFIDHVGKSDVPAHQALLAAEVESTYLMSSTSLPISL